MSSLRERVEEVMPLLGQRGIPSIREWCRLAGVQESYLNRRMHSTGSRPDFKKFEALAAVANVDPRWLAFGEGDEAGVATRAPPPDLVVLRDDERLPEDDEVPLETALFAVFAEDRRSARRYTTADFDAARAAIRATHRKTHPDADLDAHATRLLDAARQLRAENIPTDAANLMARTAVGKTDRAAEVVREVSDAYNAEVDDDLRAKGLNPEAGRTNIQAVLAKRAKR